MNINFSPVDEGFIREMVDEGYYTNATEVIRDAVRRLRQIEESLQHGRLNSALELGESAIRAGRTKPYTPELLASIERNARQRAAEGGKPDSDVCP